MRRSVLAAVLAGLAACAPNTTPITKHPYQGTPPLGAPITAGELAAAQAFTLVPPPPAQAPAQVWQWIPFPDSTCANGSPSGVAVSPGLGPDLVVFLDGGGACWDAWSCDFFSTAVDRTYGPDKFAIEIQQYLPGSLLDRTILPAAVAGATLVFVPYCTGDVHGGDNVATYSMAGIPTSTWDHVGHRNLMLYLARLAATWPSPRKLVVAGSSAGGFGALANYAAFRWYWPGAAGYLLDDSGPPLIGNAIDPARRNGWYDSWHLGVSLDAVSVDCRSDMSLAVLSLSSDHRADRLAILSRQDDVVMGTFLNDLTFGADLGALRTLVDGTRNARMFVEAGTGHMLLTPLTANAQSVAIQSSQGVALSTWLEQMLSDDPAWATVSP